MKHDFFVIMAAIQKKNILMLFSFLNVVNHEYEVPKSRSSVVFCHLTCIYLKWTSRVKYCDVTKSLKNPGLNSKYRGPGNRITTFPVKVNVWIDLGDHLWPLHSSFHVSFPLRVDAEQINSRCLMGNVSCSMGQTHPFLFVLLYMCIFYSSWLGIRLMHCVQ